MKILVTGGAGYIGSHTVVKLIEASYDVVIVDNLSNSSEKVIKRIQAITGISPELHVFSVEDKPRLLNIFRQHHFDAVIHFAGLKAVGESVQQPLAYYRSNLDATITLLEVMAETEVQKLVFSSSATVYGSAPIPYRETSETGHGITSPYGQTKYMIEQIMRDTAAANQSNQFSILRYFNPVGAHPSGQIGEDPSGTPNNLMPFIAQVAAGRRSELSIFGNDYDTPDGTCLRDYIHVEDLAIGHIAALKHLQPGCEAYNLGSGKATSVLELVNTFTKVTGQEVPYTMKPRRDGDLPAFHADSTRANDALGWRASQTIEDMCRDTWNWQSHNPNGFNA